jgi:anti-anti-sigma factor
LPAQDLLRVVVVPDRTRVAVVLQGEIDLSTGDIVRRELRELWESGWTEVVLDLREVTFMDTTAVHVLLDAREAATMAGATFGVVIGTGSAMRILALTGLDGVLPMVDPDTVHYVP